MERNVKAIIAGTAVSAFLLGLAAGISLLAIAINEPFGEQEYVDVIARYQECVKRVAPDEICFMLPVEVKREELIREYD